MCVCLFREGGSFVASLPREMHVFHGGRGGGESSEILTVGLFALQPKGGDKTRGDANMEFACYELAVFVKNQN